MEITELVPYRALHRALAAGAASARPLTLRFVDDRPAVAGVRAEGEARAGRERWALPAGARGGCSASQARSRGDLAQGRAAILARREPLDDG